MDQDIVQIEPKHAFTIEANVKAPIVTDVSSNEEAGGDSLNRVVSGPPYSIFSSKTKAFIVFMVSVSALISPFAATLYYPALNVLTVQLHVTSSLITLSITTYMVGVYHKMLILLLT